MKTPSALLGVVIGLATLSHGRADPLLGPTIGLLTNREVNVMTSAATGFAQRIDVTSDLKTWTGLALIPSKGPFTYTDSAAPFFSERFYRTGAVEGTNIVSGDLLATDEGEVTIHPINHASLLMRWKELAIYSDPVAPVTRFQGLPAADVILVTHAHGDHYDPVAISALKGSNTVILAPMIVYQALRADLQKLTTVLTNGVTTNVFGLSVEAVPAYNLTTSFHPKGVGNGYVVTIGNRKIYISGDTEDTPELRQLEGIDVAFVCMNLPYTMSVDKAVSAVRSFAPAVVYVYHYQGYSAADVNRFKAGVGTDLGIEVRLRKWY